MLAVIIASMTIDGSEAAGLSALALSPPARPVPASYMALNITGINKKHPFPAVPFRSWRSFQSVWTRTEPAPDKWDFRQLDEEVDIAYQNGIEPLLVLMLTPRWASARPQEPGVHGPGTAAEPVNMDDWVSYVRTIAQRYKGVVRHYELWNEPDVNNFFSGTVASLVRLNRAAYRTLKQVDPNIVVVSSSMATPEYLDRYLAQGGGAAADILGFHFYVGDQTPESVLELAGKIFGLRARYGLNHMPVWNTEAGWPLASATSVNRPLSGFSKVLSPSEAAAYVARAYILNWAAGIERFYWYAWKHRSSGLIEDESFALKPAAIAYSEVAHWLVGARLSKCHSNRDGTWICSLVRDRSSEAWIAWNVRGSAVLAPPRNTRFIEAHEIDGRRTFLDSGKSALIDRSPRLLILGNGPDKRAT